MAADTPQHRVREGPKFVPTNFIAFAAGLFPFLANMRGYNTGMFLADLRAALNGAAVSLPQGMAYAIIAGLPIQMGLFATALAPLVGGLLAHSRLTVMGPTNATAVMVSTGLVALGAGYNKEQVMPLFGCMIGVFLIVGAFLRVASLSQFISRTVVIGYISVAAFWIIGKQIGPAAGAHVERANSFFGQLSNTIEALHDVNLWAVCAALLTIISWYVVKKRYPHIPAIAASILLGSVVVAVYNAIRNGYNLPDLGLDYLSPVSLGDWRFTPPVVDSGLVSDLAFPALAVAFLAALENTSITKTIAAKKNHNVDLNRDLAALGASNLVCALGSSMPASGSLTRSALNVDSGAVTQLSSVFCGFFCLVGAALIGPLIGFIPEAVLAAIVICVAITLLDVPRIRCALNTTRSDMVVLLTTFVAGLIVRLDIAIFIGVATSIALFLRKVGAPQLVEYAFDEQGQLREMDEKEGREHPSISIIHVEGDLFFGAADLFRDHIRRIAADTSLKVIILRMRNARHLDATTVMALQELINFLRETGRHLIISGAMKDVYRVLKNSGTLELIGRENVFIGSSRNPNLATRNALKRARDIMGGSANVRIYYDPSKKDKQA